MCWEAQLTEAVRLRPQSAEAWNALGEAFDGSADSKMARGAFEKAIAPEPAFAQAQVNPGRNLVEAGEFGAAAKPLDRALKILGAVPDAAFPNYLRARISIEQNDAQQAAVHLEKAVSLRPDFAEAWSDLGQARKTLLDDTGALTAFTKAVAAGPDDAIAQYRPGSEYLHQGQTHPAVLHLRKAMDLNPDDQPALYALQTAFRRDGQVEQAKQTKEKLTELLKKRDKAAADGLPGVQLNNQGADFEKAGNLRGAGKRVGTGSPRAVTIHLPRLPRAGSFPACYERRRTHGARQRQPSRQPQDGAIAGDKRFGDRLTSARVAGFSGGQLIPLGFNLRPDRRRHMETVHSPL